MLGTILFFQIITCGKHFLKFRKNVNLPSYNSYFVTVIICMLSYFNAQNLEKNTIVVEFFCFGYLCHCHIINK